MQGRAIGCARGQLQGIGSRRLLHVNTGERVPGIPILGLGEDDCVVKPGAMYFAGRLFQIDPEEHGGAAFEAQRRPAYFLCVCRRSTQKQQNENEPGVDFHLLSIEPVPP